MKYVGEFLEKEIDGKPFHIFTFTPQTDNPSSSGGDLSLLPPTLFLCPSFRLDVENSRRKKIGDSTEDEIIPLTTLPYFQNTKSFILHKVQLLDSYDIALLEDPVAPSLWFIRKNVDKVCDICARGESGTGYYVCDMRDGYYHKECVEAPLEIKVHPAYPFLSLRLCTPPRLYDPKYGTCLICNDKVRRMGYYCFTYNVHMHPLCALKPIPIFINHSKRHPHPLTFFPKQTSLACDVCGMVKKFLPTYICAQCVFVVHQDCIYFPYVIRISRHQHRISFTYSLPSGKLSCGVCRKNVDNNYGAYSCKQCDGYFVHSRCALRRDLWDGEELEGVPEEPEVIVDPYKIIADGIILHFSHGHHLKLEVMKVYDENNFCQACILPIYEGNYYACVLDDCRYILHEICANAPLKKHHPLNPRLFDLKVVSDGGYFECSACQRQSCGFVYESSWNNFRLDVRCASIYEPYQYEGHPHPLYLALTPEEEESKGCHICNDGYRKLSCVECDFIICFKCATIPYKVRYKHDKHFLTYRRTNAESDWCEACETKITCSGFYACDDYCCTTLHVDCLLGSEPYLMKTGEIELNNWKVHILLNNTMSRPLCSYEDFHRGIPYTERCGDKVFFRTERGTCCSYHCLIHYGAY